MLFKILLYIKNASHFLKNINISSVLVKNLFSRNIVFPHTSL